MGAEALMSGRRAGARRKYLDRDSADQGGRRYRERETRWIPRARATPASPVTRPKKPAITTSNGHKLWLVGSAATSQPTRASTASTNPVVIARTGAGKPRRIR